MNVEAIWHDLECGGYGEDLPLWQELAAQAGGPVLDIGAGTGRVSLALAVRGVEVVSLDQAAGLLAALAVRADGLPVETVVADACAFSLHRRFSLIIVPMQTLQLLGGREGRARFFRCAFDHLEPGGLIACALADALDCFDADHPLAPPAQTREVLGVRYSSRLLRVTEEDGAAALHRRRVIVSVGDERTEDVVVHLDRVSPAEVAAEAEQLGYITEPYRHVPESEQYLGSTVVMLRRRDRR